MRQINSCEVCGSQRLSEVLNLGFHPLCDDLIPISSDKVSSEFPIEILLCSDCFTAHQKFQIPKSELFPTNYNYRSRFTSDVISGMSQLVNNVNEFLPGGLLKKTVLDIGSNDGSLLKIFQSFGSITIGVEPTEAAMDSTDQGHFIYQNYFDDNIVDAILLRFGFPDVITFTNVFAHIEDLGLLLKNLVKLIGPETLLVIENHYLGSILSGKQFDTFYHEHPRTYSASSFIPIAQSLQVNINLIEFPERYGGNIRIFMSRNLSRYDYKKLEAIVQNEQIFPSQFVELKEMIQKYIEQTSLKINQINKIHGPVPAKAFPGRAAILLKILNIDEKNISVVFEKPGSKKIGKFVPGTRIPISSDDEFLKIISSTTVVINLAWHISVEINDYLKKLGYNGEMIDILDPSLF
jgi:hypothetical protein